MNKLLRLHMLAVHKLSLLTVACGIVVCSLPAVAHAAEPITYRYKHYLFQIDPDAYPHWRGEEEVWLYKGEPLVPLQSWRVDGDTIPPLPDGIERSSASAWDRAAIATSLHARLGLLEREPGKVSISYSGSGTAVFDGLGLPGRTIQMDQLVALTIAAIERDVTDVVIPLTEIQPQITLESPELQKRGISEVVTVGESNFAGSPNNRRHNIAVGLAKFNGHIIPKGSVFSFNDILGPVNYDTGYKPELVIMGDKTLPEYGGGLCQVSTTAYRGVWEYGFPIEQRRNHSFSVAYYGPQGTDATIYPPHTDMKFTNDSDSDLLIQTHVDGDEAYFIYYGTRDRRSTEIIGPYTWAHTAAPPEKIEYTTDLAPGERKKVGSAVPGLRAAWFRVVRAPDAEPSVEGFYSFYEARPLFYQVGIAADNTGPTDAGDAPAWLMAPDAGGADAPGEQPAQDFRVNPRSLRE